MSAQSFGLYANPKTSTADISVNRSFSGGKLTNGQTFSLQWGVNWDSDGQGNKGFNLYSGGPTNSSNQIININMGGSSAITLNGVAVFTNYGSNAMTWSFTAVSSNQLKIVATPRDGSANSYTNTLTVAGLPDSFRLYASQLEQNGGDRRQPYFNNFTILSASPDADGDGIPDSTDPDDDNDGLTDAWELGSGRYDVILGSFTWDQAKADAEARGGYLATITTALEKTNAASQVTQAAMNELWLGGYKNGTNWSWVTGEPWNESAYHNWMPGEPGVTEGQNYLRLKSFDEGWDNWFSTPTFSPFPVTIRGYLLERGFPTDPLLADTDGDGFNDGAEVNGTSPLGRVTSPVKKNYEKLMVAGDFLTPAWSDSPNATNSMIRVPDQEFTYGLTYHFRSLGTFTGKFLADSWAKNWGASGTNGIAASPGADISIPVKATGIHVFTFNHDTLAYSIVRATPDGLTYSQWAAQYGLAADSGSADSDTDGLNNTGEYGANTDPFNGDTDGDGYTDKVEVEGTSALGRATDPLKKNYASMLVARDFSVPPWNEAPSAPYQMALAGDDYTWVLSKRFTNPATLGYKFVGGGTWANTWGASGTPGQAVAGGGNLGGTVAAAGIYTFTFNTETLATSFVRASFANYAAFASAFGLAAGSGGADADGDGRTNGEEHAANTDPLLADTDGDGRNDAAEATAGTDALTTNHTVTLIGESLDGVFPFPHWTPEPWPTNAAANVMNPGTGTNQFLHTLNLRMTNGLYKVGFANGKKDGACGQIKWFGSGTPGLAQAWGQDLFWGVPASGIWQATFNTQSREYGFARLPTNGLTYDQWAAQYELGAGSEADNADYQGGSGDFLSNGQEYAANTDPLNPDSDQDGLFDDQEINGDFSEVYKNGVASEQAPLFSYNTNSTPPTGIRLNPLTHDTDGDWLSDFFEVYYGLDPTDDGVQSNSYRNFTGLTLAATNANPNGRGADPDGDDFTNLEEEWSGTSPTLASSKPVERLLTFQVDMRQEMVKTNNPFDPAKHGVEVRGEFNDWQPGLTLTNSSATNGIYVGQYLVRAHTNHPKTFSPENRILYKFYGILTNTSGNPAPALGYEPYEERYYGYEWTTNGVAVTNRIFDPVVFGQNISKRNVTFTVDLGTQVALGRFNPSTDKVYLIGDAPDWRNPADWTTGNELTKDNSFGPGDHFYSTTLEFLGPYDLDRNYKYRIVTGSGEIREINDLYPESCGWQGNRGFKMKGSGDNFTFTETFNRWVNIPAVREVTFMVDMSVQAALGRFVPGTDKVYLVGDPAQGQPRLEMSRVGATSSYELAVGLWGAVGTKMNYKFQSGNPAVGNGGYEGDMDPDDGNGDTQRQITLGPADTPVALASVPFNGVSTAPSNRDVAFAVDMSVQEALDLFDPATHKVFLMGDVTDWSSGREMIREGTSLTYKLTLRLGGDEGISKRGFKFRSGSPLAANGGWEGDVNPATDEDRRIVTLGPAGVEQDTGLQLFNNDDTVVRDVTFAVDMSIQQAMGRFTPGTDKVYLVGEVSDWITGVEMARQGETSIYQVTRPVPGAANAVRNYKFRSGNAAVGNGGYEGDVNPAGDKDTRVLTLAAAGAAQDLVTVYFNNASEWRNVSFAVNMAVQQELGKFTPGTDKVYLVGEATDWNTGVEMTRDGPTGIYRLTYPVPGTNNAVLNYKFKSGNAAVGNGGYEADLDAAQAGDQARILTLAAGPAVQELAEVFFNNVDVAPLRTVAFAVDMRVQAFKGNFAAGEKVVVSGGFNGWGTNNELTLDTDSGLHRGTLTVEGAAGATNNYKFRILGPTRTNEAAQFESTPDRELVLGAIGSTNNLTNAFFNNVSESRKITFRVDMSVQAAKGNFNTNSGVVQIAGSFNGWSTMATPLSAQGNGVYAAEVTVDGPVSGISYKFLKGTEEGDYEAVSDRTISAVLPNLAASALEPVFFGNDDGLAPTNISLSASAIAENNAVNAVVGTLSSTDATAGDTHTYSLVAGTGDMDNASFNISGSLLRAGVAFDFETKASYSIRVRSTDAKGNSFEKPFTITVLEVTLPPGGGGGGGGVDNSNLLPGGQPLNLTGWLSGQTMSPEILGKLAIGGASSAIANDGEKPVVTLAGNQLVLSVVVRTNGPVGLQVVGEAVSSLAGFSDTNQIIAVTGQPAAVQGTVPPGCQRQEFKLNQDGERKFLRLKVTLP